MNLALNGNWVDLVIIVVVIFFIYQGFVHGLWSILIDFISFLGSLLLALKTYPLISSLLAANFSFSKNLGNAIGFLLSAVLIEILLSYLLARLIKKLPSKIIKNQITKFLGILLSFGQGIILIAFGLTLAISLPIKPSIKTDISNSKIGSLILTRTAGLEKTINSIFGSAINDSLTYLTIEPNGKDSVPLDNTSENLEVDEVSETEMFKLVNFERVDRNGKALVWDTKLVEVARDYAKKMWHEKYFGHYDKEGKDVGDRLQKEKINYTLAGENLALAPTVTVAHSGLMNSPGHKANILEEGFGKVGIGVIENGYYGKIFVQVFITE